MSGIFSSRVFLILFERKGFLSFHKFSISFNNTFKTEQVKASFMSGISSSSVLLIVFEHKGFLSFDLKTHFWQFHMCSQTTSCLELILK